MWGPLGDPLRTMSVAACWPQFSLANLAQTVLLQPLTASRAPQWTFVCEWRGGVGCEVSVDRRLCGAVGINNFSSNRNEEADDSFAPNPFSGDDEDRDEDQEGHAYSKQRGSKLHYTSTSRSNSEESIVPLSDSLQTLELLLREALALPSDVLLCSLAPDLDLDSERRTNNQHEAFPITKRQRQQQVGLLFLLLSVGVVRWLVCWYVGWLVVLECMSNEFMRCDVAVHVA
jgi:hypothetical protein